jgi:hypothetical protein
VEVGKFDIYVKVAILSKGLAYPCQGHMEAVFDILAYLWKYKQSKLAFNDACVNWGNKFQAVDWKGFYPVASELIPPNVPESCGKCIKLNCFVVADHNGKRVTWQSNHCVLLFQCSAPIMWYSKRQNKVETPTFRAEFIAAKTPTEKFQALQYKLHMMGKLIDGPMNMFCDNEAVVRNLAMPESNLKKKHVAICYHWVQEVCALGLIQIV